MTFLSNYLQHAHAVGRAAEQLGIRVSTRHPDFNLVLEKDGETTVWPPKFFAWANDRVVYTYEFDDRVFGFAGWMPSAPQQWPIAVDKIAFKRFAIESGIDTPAACFDPSQIQGPFIIKQANSSFGEGIRGPYVTHDAADPMQQLRDGEYYENFVVGLIAKAWYCGASLVAVHLHKPTMVVGNGTDTLRELVRKLPNVRRKNDWELVGRLARYCGVESMDSVISEGKEVLAEYRYGSRYEEPSYKNGNCLAELDGGLRQAFSRAGDLIFKTVAGPADTLAKIYTLDAVVDSAGAPLFLEMNCNPVVHPDAYALYCAILGGKERPSGQELAPSLRLSGNDHKAAIASRGAHTAA